MASSPFPAFLGDEEVSRLEERINELAQLGVNGDELGLLVGAGFSFAAAAMPLGNDLATLLIRKALGQRCSLDTATQIAAKYGLAAAAQRFEAEATGERRDLIQFLREELGQTATRPERSLELLAQVTTLAAIQRLYTTNYDTLIEQSFPARAAMTVYPNADSVKEFERRAKAEDTVGVFHIYGDVNDPKITDNDFENLSPFHVSDFQHQLKLKVFAFVGYSFRDEHLVRAYNHIAEVLAQSGDVRKSFIVMPVSDPYEYSFASKLWLKKRNMVLLPMGSDEFLSLLADRMTNLHSEVAARKLAERAKVPIDVAKERLRQIKDAMPILSEERIEEIAASIRKLK